MATAMEDRLETMLARLKLSAVRERLDNLLDEAGRRELSLRESLILLCEAEGVHREERRMRMGSYRPPAPETTLLWPSSPAYAPLRQGQTAMPEHGPPFS